MCSPGTWLSLCEQQETRSLAKLSSSLPWLEKCHLGKMNDRWVISIYEVENARTHPPPCLAVIEVCLVCRSLCEVNKGVRGKAKSEAQSTMMRFLAVIFSKPSHVTLKGPTPSTPPHSSGWNRSLPVLFTTWQVCHRQTPAALILSQK